MEILAGIILMIIIVGAIIIFDSFAWGLVTFKFWSWFLLPVFPMLPQLTFFQAVGLSIFFVLFKNHSYSEKKKKIQKQKLFLYQPIHLLH